VLGARVFLAAHRAAEGLKKLRFRLIALQFHIHLLRQYPLWRRRLYRFLTDRGWKGNRLYAFVWVEN
jgi:hypothetical protein